VTQQQHAREILSLAGSLARAQWDQADDLIGIPDVLDQIEARTQRIRNEMKEASNGLETLDSSGDRHAGGCRDCEGLQAQAQADRYAAAAGSSAAHLPGPGLPDAVLDR
jgi:hypothetical protein